MASQSQPWLASEACQQPKIFSARKNILLWLNTWEVEIRAIRIEGAATPTALKQSMGWCVYIPIKTWALLSKKCSTGTTKTLSFILDFAFWGRCFSLNVMSCILSQITGEAEAIVKRDVPIMTCPEFDKINQPVEYCGLTCFQNRTDGADGK